MYIYTYIHIYIYICICTYIHTPWHIHIQHPTVLENIGLFCERVLRKILQQSSISCKWDLSFVQKRPLFCAKATSLLNEPTNHHPPAPKSNSRVLSYFCFDICTYMCIYMTAGCSNHAVTCACARPAASISSKNKKKHAPCTPSQPPPPLPSHLVSCHPRPKAKVRKINSGHHSCGRGENKRGLR